MIGIFISRATDGIFQYVFRTNRSRMLTTFVLGRCIMVQAGTGPSIRELLVLYHWISYITYLGYDRFVIEDEDPIPTDFKADAMAFLNVGSIHLLEHSLAHYPPSFCLKRNTSSRRNIWLYSKLDPRFTRELMSLSRRECISMTIFSLNILFIRDKQIEIWGYGQDEMITNEWTKW